MDKRHFVKSLLFGGITLPNVLGHTSLLQKEVFFEQVTLLAQKLKKGDSVGLVTPAGVLDDEEPITICKEIFNFFGLKVVEGDHIRQRYGHLAGTDEDRLADLHRMFVDKGIQAIVCIRGGSGTSRLLDRLDYDLIRRHPKIVLGYSDITALLLAVYAKTGLVGFHGAVGISQWTMTVARGFKAQFFENQTPLFKNPKNRENTIVNYHDRVTTITGGTAEGILLGGNMTVLTGLCGSPYLPDFNGAILFLEEVDESMERVDRMFCQLKNTGILKQIKGFVFGKCTDCTPASGGYGSLTLQQILNDYIKPLNIPAYQGAMIGHFANQFFLPVGGKVRVDADLGTIELLSPALKN